MTKTPSPGAPPCTQWAECPLRVHDSLPGVPSPQLPTESGWYKTTTWNRHGHMYDHGVLYWTVEGRSCWYASLPEQAFFPRQTLSTSGSYSYAWFLHSGGSLFVLPMEKPDLIGAQDQAWLEGWRTAEAAAPCAPLYSCNDRRLMHWNRGYDDFDHVQRWREGR